MVRHDASGKGMRSRPSQVGPAMVRELGIFSSAETRDYIPGVKLEFGGRK